METNGDMQITKMKISSENEGVVDDVIKKNQNVQIELEIGTETNFDMQITKITKVSKFEGVADDVIKKNQNVRLS